MPAGAAGDDDLQVRFFSHRARVARAFFESAETAARRRRAFLCRVFVHGVRFTRASHFTLPKLRDGMRWYRLFAAAVAALVVTGSPVGAERPIVDLHRLDAYFELFAGDSSVPWKATTVRLDTYSSAAVAFSVYQVDPAEVLSAGSNSRSRPIVTSGRRALLSFNFSPPDGYQFQSNEVTVPIGSREGFFVVEARRGNVGEQVWINRSRIGVVAKETPSGILVYGADLGTGMPLSRMRVQFVVNRAFVTSMTNNDGIVTWNRAPRPVFVLAQWGASYAFLSLLPQAPLPQTIVGVRTDSAVVHAGEVVRIVGFARTRSRSVLRPSIGAATVTIRSGAAALAESRVALDGAGAFVTSLRLPVTAAAGDYAVLAQAAGGVGGATLHVDANAGALSLNVSAACNLVCDSHTDVPLIVHASRGDAVLHVTVVRSPHAYPTTGSEQAESEITPWGTTRWFDTSLRTDERGDATLLIPHPNDDLPSTYGVRVESGGATAETRVLVPTAQAELRLQLDRDEQTLGTPIGFDVYAGELDGSPLANATVTVEMVHGPSIARQQLRLDAQGHARGSFSAPPLGTNLLFAFVDRGGRAKDGAQLQIDPHAGAASTGGASANVQITLDKRSYRAGEDIAIEANAPGSQGEALLTFESALGIQARRVRIAGGRATVRLRVSDAPGEVRAGAVFVRDGALVWNAIPVALRGPGRPDFSHVALARQQFAPGEAAHVSLDGVTSGHSTIVVRISRGEPSGSALFTSAPALLAVGAATTQSSAPESVTWHPWVNSTGDHAQVLGFVRRTQPPLDASLAQAETEAVTWSVQRSGAGEIPIALPERSGRYTLSVLDICDDGSVVEGTSTVVVR